MTHLKAPGNIEIELFQPKYKKKGRHDSARTQLREKGKAKTGNKIR